MRVTKKNLGKVLRELERLGADPNMAKGICAALDEMLNELLEQDFFGTEGQLDPRGDRRG